MSEPHERLTWAWKTRGFETAADAARALGVTVTTFQHHSNGRRNFKPQAAERYGRFFRVRPEWLMTGRGDPRAATERATIPVTGLVGAGAAVEMIGDTSGVEPPMEIDFPDLRHVAAMQVHGDSQWPRFMHGEWVLYDTRPVPAANLLGHYAVVQTLEDGRRLIKRLKRGGTAGRFTLVSHNAEDEENVELLCAWRIIGLMF